ncbi:MAG TPA: hypothetical protein VEF55_08635 [Candidatus Binatia bacterium]|nr:hypothetical protein [Candidatus Binatia bacterium]
MVKWLLMVAAAYLGVIGLALIFVPLKFGVGAVPPNASPELLALLRLLGGPLLGIAVLDGITGNTEASPTLRAVLIANFVGFGAVAANDLHGVFTGEARELARMFLVIHLAFTAAFAFAALRRSQR